MTDAEVKALRAATYAVWAAMKGVCTNDVVCKTMPCACAEVFARAALDAAATESTHEGRE
jgi:hypothetical protein